MTAEPLCVGDHPYVRIRDHYSPMPPFRLHLYILTPPKTRGIIDGRKFLTRQSATSYATEHGWRVLG